MHFCCTLAAILFIGTNSLKLRIKRTKYITIQKKGKSAMKILKEQNGKTMTLTLEGRLDTTTSPELEAVLVNELGDAAELILDFEHLEYISSAGLRVLLTAQKKMNTQGTMIIRNVCETVREVFEITGFSDILTIQ